MIKMLLKENIERGHYDMLPKTVFNFYFQSYAIII